jgi:hypothetical protein
MAAKFSEFQLSVWLLFINGKHGLFSSWSPAVHPLGPFQSCFSGAKLGLKQFHTKTVKQSFVRISG